ncbi:MAG: penicillin acylase family protein [Gammaproteobacteria bacterium]|nr:penicillin acylase family protein [Gammaproteobacteria bacterium]
MRAAPTRALLPICLLAWIAGCSGNGAPPDPPPPPPTAPAPPETTFQAEIRRTEYGIPHIKADDWGSLGYGYGYAYAQDRFCVAMAAIVFATSRSAELLGEQHGDITADFVLRYLLGTKQEFRQMYLTDRNDEAILLAEGFAAGMNRYLRETGVENLPGGDQGCRDAGWVYEIDAADVWMHIARVQLSGSSDQSILRRAIFAPDGPDGTLPVGYSDAEWQEIERALGRDAHPFGFAGDGSNALAVGRDFSQTGKGLLLGNPHLSWSGPSGFHQLHLTIPGEYDVAGAALHGVPWVGIGFNGDLAWTHTTSFASRFTLYELQLNPDDPLQYRYEDEWRDITSEDVTIEVKLDDGTLEERTHTFYRSHYGPIVSLREVSDLLGTWPLPNGNLYSMRDANAVSDLRAFDQYLDMGRARTVAEFTEALKRIGIPVFHVFAADRDGEAFYGEIAGIPHVTRQQLDDCATELGRLIAFATNDAVLTLDGSSAECEWGEDPDSPPGTNLYGYEARPKLHTTDYVGNGNDSYWLTNADNPLTGFPVVFGWLGHENKQQSLRTRIGHLMVRERREATDGLDEAAGFTLDSMKAFMYRNRMYGAEIVLDDVLATCEGLTGVNASEERGMLACAALTDWDRKVDPESRGAQVFTEFWRAVRRELGNDFNLLIESRSFWTVDFDPADPLNTPRGIDRSRAGNRELVVSALSDAVVSLEQAGIALDAPWREAQFVTRNGVRIPVHGGDPEAGVYGAISARLGDGGYTPRSGNTYIQAVTWNDTTCPIADAILAPSQSIDPESPHYADQTELYSRKEWVPFPYCEEEIEAAQIGETVIVEE